MDQMGIILDTVIPGAIGMDLTELNFDLCAAHIVEGQIQLCRDIICEVIRHNTIQTHW